MEHEQAEGEKAFRISETLFSFFPQKQLPVLRRIILTNPKFCLILIRMLKQGMNQKTHPFTVYRFAAGMKRLQRVDADPQQIEIGYIDGQLGAGINRFTCGKRHTMRSVRHGNMIKRDYLSYFFIFNRNCDGISIQGDNCERLKWDKPLYARMDEIQRGGSNEDYSDTCGN